MSHTKTPWLLDSEYFVIDEKGQLIAETQSENDAAHIVHCVNSHDELMHQRDELRAAAQSLINALMPIVNRENSYDNAIADVLRAIEKCK